MPINGNHTTTMEFCPPNITIGQIWLNRGWSPCFMDTVSVSAIAGFLLVFGSAQLFMYRRYGSRNDDVPPSRLYTLQQILHVLVPALELVRFMLQATTSNDNDHVHIAIFGYQILHLSLTLFVYAFLSALLVCERNRLLPSTPTHGHGLVLLCSWTLLFVVENLQLINMNSNDWLDLTSTRYRMEVSVFAVRYFLCLLIFIIGLKAPGISRPPNEDYNRLHTDGGASAVIYDIISCYWFLLIVFFLGEPFDVVECVDPPEDTVPVSLAKE